MNELYHYDIPGMKWGRKINRKYQLDSKVKGMVPDLPDPNSKVSFLEGLEAVKKFFESPRFGRIQMLST